jgi:hypothetical protein
MSALPIVRRVNAWLRTPGCSGVALPTEIPVDKIRCRRQYLNIEYHSKHSHAWHILRPHEEIKIFQDGKVVATYPGSLFL